MIEDWDLDYEEEVERPPDPLQESAREHLRAFFNQHREDVFFSRQIEVQNEGPYFHWVTNRAIRDLVSEGVLNREKRKLRTGGTITVLWHRSYRYYKRNATRLISIVEDYSDPNIGAAIGLWAELLVLEGFSRIQFVMKGRNTKSYEGKTWTETDHDLDFIFERDSVVYGVEVKNKLGYMDHDELKTKVRLCQYLGIKPLFAVRFLPKDWIWQDIIKMDGYAMILKYQLYPLTHKALAKRASQELGLPVDTPKALEEATMTRFIRNFHEKHVN